MTNPACTLDPFVKLVTSEDLTGDAKQIFENVKAANGKVPKWMKAMGNSPEVFVHFFRLFKTTMGEGSVKSLLKWKVAFRVSELNKCEFCVSVTKTKLRCMGLSEEEIAQIDTPVNETEALVLKFAESTTEHAYNILPETKAALRKTFSDEQVVELTAAVGLFNFINRFNDSLDIFPDLT